MIESYKMFKINGKTELLTLEQAYKIGTPEVLEQIERIKLAYNSKRMIKDGFEPGFQANINEYCPDRASYNRALKEKGLVELGKDTSSIRDTTTTGGYCNTVEFALEARKIGIELSDQEVDAIASGEYFDSSKVDLSGSESTSEE